MGNDAYVWLASKTICERQEQKKVEPVSRRYFLPGTCGKKLGARAGGDSALPL